MQSRNANTKQSSKNPLYDTSNYNSKDLFFIFGGWERMEAIILHEKREGAAAYWRGPFFVVFYRDWAISSCSRAVESAGRSRCPCHLLG